MIRVRIPSPLCVLIGEHGELEVGLDEPASANDIVDALEARFPPLRGTIRDPATRTRRPFIRYFAAGEDLSHEPPDGALPATVYRGEEPFIILGAIAGG